MKQQTQSLHTQLEDTVNIFRHLSSLYGYLYILKLFWGFYSPIEAQVALITGIDGIDFQSRRKVPLLLADLYALGMQEDEIIAIPHCANLLHLDDLPRVFGYLYVAEGSTLGGQVISKHIGNLLGIGIGNGAAFFNGYGDRTGIMWLNFKKGVETLIQDAESEQKVLEAAHETFACLIHWFELGRDAYHRELQ